MHDVPSGGILCAFVEHEKYIPDIYIYIFESADTWKCWRHLVFLWSKFCGQQKNKTTTGRVLALLVFLLSPVCIYT